MQKTALASSAEGELSSVRSDGIVCSLKCPVLVMLVLSVVSGLFEPIFPVA